MVHRRLLFPPDADLPFVVVLNHADDVSVGKRHTPISHERIPRQRATG